MISLVLKDAAGADVATVQRASRPKKGDVLDLGDERQYEVLDTIEDQDSRRGSTWNTTVILTVRAINAGH
jgi:hypothetical protein